MSKFLENNPIRRFYLRVFAIILFAVLIFFIVKLFGIYGKMAESRNDLKEAENKAALLEQKKIDLEDELNKIDTPVGKEEEIRSKYGFVKDGESMAVVIDYNRYVEKAVIEKKSFFNNLLDKVKKLF